MSDLTPDELIDGNHKSCYKLFCATLCVLCATLWLNLHDSNYKHSGIFAFT